MGIVIQTWGAKGFYPIVMDVSKQLTKLRLYGGFTPQSWDIDLLDVIKQVGPGLFSGSVVAMGNSFVLKLP